MDKSKVVAFETPEGNPRDILTGIIREGAVKLLAQALEVEIQSFIEDYQGLRLADGKQQIVRNGYLKERKVQTGIGGVPVRVPRSEDRSKSGIAYESVIVPRYLRRSKSIEELLPWLYLKGISTGGFEDALKALLGENAQGLKASTISRLKNIWTQEYQDWTKRDLSDKRYVYFWVDGIHMNARFSDGKQCILVILGCDANGNKDLVGITDGYAESAQSWKELLLTLKDQGLKDPPELAIGDGALGFWKAFREVYGNAKEQRCWVHKTENVLDKLPKILRDQAKSHLHNIWMAPGKEEADKAFDLFVKIYEAKYPKATECLTKDRQSLLTFYGFPAEHWRHIRSTNPIESMFSCVRLRTTKTRGCLSRETGLAMVYKLCHSSKKRWHQLNGIWLIKEVLNKVVFIDGVKADARMAA